MKCLFAPLISDKIVGFHYEGEKKAMHVRIMKLFPMGKTLKKKIGEKLGKDVQLRT